jgi:ATP-dependent DNA helicase 2 subunit 2
LRNFTADVRGVIVPIDRALELMSYFQKKSVLQRTTFRGRFEITQDLGIGVYGYIKCKEQLFPAPKKISNATHGPVQMSRTLQSAQDPDTEIPSSDAVKAYCYGKSLVPFSKVDAAFLKPPTERCLKLIGFTAARSVPRYHFMGSTEMLVADPNDPSAKRAFSAVVAAMAETDSFAIARYVRAKGSAPQLVALIPHVKVGLDCLYLQYLPFLEDLRVYPFTPLSAADPLSRKDTRPTQEQLKVAQQLITDMDLMDVEDPEGESGEALQPKEAYNPAL